jgi:hypothetical protein
MKLVAVHLQLRRQLVNLAENGVSTGIFTDLLCQSLKDTIFSLFLTFLTAWGDEISGCPPSLKKTVG